MFWGLIVQPNKKYSKTVSTAFHVSQAVLDISSMEENEVQLILVSDKVEYILCILSKSDTVQVPLDLIFSEGDEIAFRTVGGTVHLTGYLVDDQDYNSLEQVESSDADEEVPILVSAPRAKNRVNAPVPQEQDSSSENGEISGGEEGSGDDDDVEEIEDEAEAESEDDDESDEEPTFKKIIKEKNGVPNGVRKVEKIDKLKKHQQQTTTTDKPKHLPGGLKIQDIRVGNGPAAKPGKKVEVYYEGRFKTNNKIFDKSNAGKGFEFTLGRNEVIKGWDNGVAGMKTGGKRRIICPPNMAYGSKGSPPAIPPNATLIFDVELRGVH